MTRHARRTVLCLAMTAASLLEATGCLEVGGGAVEVGWVVRDSEESARNCADLGITDIRVTVVPADTEDASDLCSTGAIGRCTFSCNAGYGITPFKIPPGDYYFGLVPLDANRRPLGPDRCSLPAPVRRNVAQGQLLELGVWQVVVAQEAGTP